MPTRYGVQGPGPSEHSYPLRMLGARQVQCSGPPPRPQSQSLVWECHVNGRMTASSALGTPPHLRAPPRRCLSSRERLLLSTPTRSLGRTHVTPDPQHPIYLQEWGGCSSSSTPEQVVSTAGWLHRACSIRNAVSSSSCLCDSTFGKELPPPVLERITHLRPWAWMGMKPPSPQLSPQGLECLASGTEWQWR